MVSSWSLSAPENTNGAVSTDNGRQCWTKARWNILLLDRFPSAPTTPLLSFRSSHDQGHDTRKHVSHDSHAAAPTAWALSHVPEAWAHDIAVSPRPRSQCKWRHAADTDAPSAPAASSGSRVSQDHSGALGFAEGRLHRGVRLDPCLVFLHAAASQFNRPRRGSTPTLPTAPSIPKSSQVSSNKNQVGRHLSPLLRLLYLALACFYRPLACYADKDAAADFSDIVLRLILTAPFWRSQAWCRTRTTPIWTPTISASSGNRTSRASGRRYMTQTAKSCGWISFWPICTLSGHQGREEKQEKTESEVKEVIIGWINNSAERRAGRALE